MYTSLAANYLWSHPKAGLHSVIDDDIDSSPVEIVMQVDDVTCYASYGCPVGSKPMRTSSTDDCGGTISYFDEIGIAATIVNQGIGLVVSLMNNVTAVDTLGHGATAKQLKAARRARKLDNGDFRRSYASITEDLTGYAPSWFESTDRRMDVYAGRRRAVFNKKCRVDLLPLEDDNDHSKDHELVYAEWVNPSTLLRLLAFTYNGKTVRTIHILFRSWPDNGVPSNLLDPASFTDLLDMLRMVYAFQFMSPSPDTTRGGIYSLGLGVDANHMLVHCLAGIGRTGTFLTMYRYLLPISPAAISIPITINQLRICRGQDMVYTADQLAFIYKVIVFVRGSPAYLEAFFSKEMADVFAENDTNVKRYGQVYADILDVGFDALLPPIEEPKPSPIGKHGLILSSFNSLPPFFQHPRATEPPYTTR